MSECVDSKAIKFILLLFIINILVFIFAVPSGTYGQPITYNEPEEAYEQTHHVPVMITSTQPQCYIQLSDDEIIELATLVYLEANTESYECQKAVASVVINRMMLYDKSLKDIVYEANQFTPANLIKYNEPNETNLTAVRDVVSNGPNIPQYVCYFRADRYHNWNNDIIPYQCIDNTYFSYAIQDKESAEL